MEKNQDTSAKKIKEKKVSRKKKATICKSELRTKIRSLDVSLRNSALSTIGYFEVLRLYQNN